jgi:glycerophosphoryl diester phosphodiesterase
LQIIAHRGYWNKHIKPNSWESFEQAFKLGYGIETDFRDFNGQLVVSHDPPLATNDLIFATDFFNLASKYPNQMLAINIKADGLQTLITNLLLKYNLNNYFVFDASVPDLYRYQEMNCNFYTRISEIERSPNLFEKSSGIWLDAFNSEWYNEKTILDLLNHGKKVAIVSSELHKRPYEELWKFLKKLNSSSQYNNLFLCTDFTDEANNYFNNL